MPPPYASRTETVAGISAFALTIAALGLPLYLLAKLSRRKRIPAPAPQ